MTCTEPAPNHNKGTGTATIEAAQDDPIQHTEDTAAGPTVTHHTGHTLNPQYITAPQAMALRIAEGHTHDHPTDC